MSRFTPGDHLVTAHLGYTTMASMSGRPCHPLSGPNLGLPVKS